MKILVTGDRGYIGAVLIPILKEKDYVWRFSRIKLIIFGDWRRGDTFFLAVGGKGNCFFLAVGVKEIVFSGWLKRNTFFWRLA